MAKKILVKGDDKTVDHIKQENRVRVRKGKVTITPADDDVEGVTSQQYENLQTQVSTLQGQVEALAQQVEALTSQLSTQGNGGEGGDNSETPGEGGNTETPGEGGDNAGGGDNTETNGGEG